MRTSYKPSYLFDRTPEERRDIFLSWRRDDQAFFANGACHILANLFSQIHEHEGYNMVHIKPNEGHKGNHVFASNGEWAFDHNGWTRESELLYAVEQGFSSKYPDWSYEKIIIDNSKTSLEEFCKVNNHLLPWQYANLPWERAYKFIEKFSATPPNS